LMGRSGYCAWAMVAAAAMAIAPSTRRNRGMEGLLEVVN
jgi:hypothetical protein